MTDKQGPNNENGNGNGLKSISSELEKANEKVKSAANYAQDLDKMLENLQEIKSKLQTCELDGEFPVEAKLRLASIGGETKTKVIDLLKTHREVHGPVSKFGKVVDKTFVSDINHLAVHFNDKRADKMDDSITMEDLTSDKFTADQYLLLVIIEHLLRSGQHDIALKLADEACLSLDDIGFQRFKMLDQLVGSMEKGDLQPAKQWLASHKDKLLKKEFVQFEFALAKLEFLSGIQQPNINAKAILNHARKLSPYAAEFPSDFEHMMGSIAFIDKPLGQTPYADLLLTTPIKQEEEVNERMDVDEVEEGQIVAGEATNQHMHVNYQPTAQGYDVLAGGGGKDLLSRTASLFHAAACRQIGLSHVDPLFTAFSAGCRVLPKLHELKQAIASIINYSSDANILPVSVKLDPIAYRHNIFHCPVMKEISNQPVRLNCGHAISRDAFNSLASSERSKIKCPYCPLDTHRNQVQDLKFG